MSLPTSGLISLSQIAVELGQAANYPASLSWVKSKTKAGYQANDLAAYRGLAYYQRNMDGNCANGNCNCASFVTNCTNCAPIYGSTNCTTIPIASACTHANCGDLQCVNCGIGAGVNCANCDALSTLQANCNCACSYNCTAVQYSYNCNCDCNCMCSCA